MINDDIFSNTLEPVKVTPAMKKIWTGISRWAIFFSILGFFGVLIGIISLMVSITSLLSAPRYSAMPGYNVGYISSSALTIGISFAVHYFHIKFAMDLQSAISSDSQRLFDSAWRNFRNHFRLFGILMILVIALVAVFVFYFSLYLNVPYYRGY